MSERIPRSPHALLLPAAFTMLAANLVLVGATLFTEDDSHRVVTPTSKEALPVEATKAVSTVQHDRSSTGAEDPTEPPDGAAARVDRGLVARARTPGEIVDSVLAPRDHESAVRQAVPRHRPQRTTAELLATLSDVTTLDLFDAPYDRDEEDEKRRYRRMRNRIVNAPTRPPELALPHPLDGPLWRDQRPDFAGLPVLEGDHCQLSEDESVELRRVATEVGREAANAGRLAASTHRHQAPGAWFRVQGLVEAAEDEFDPSGLHQILQIAPPQIRRMLVRELAENESAESTSALVQRALFDFDSGIRHDAVEALATRPKPDYTALLLRAFEHPWAPAAEHAADALVTLGRTDVVDSLRELDGRPDPRAPFKDAWDRWFAYELVRVNHLRNCLLCHAPSRVPFAPRGTSPFHGTISTTRPTPHNVDPDPKLPEGFVPDPYAPLPQVYYSGRNGSGLFVRADVTYVWQDFSVVMQTENRHASWPERQRFDFFVRKKHVSETEARELATRYPTANSPHRRALQYALRALGGA